MSQAKVDQYKEHKKNRKEEYAKEKKMKKIRSIITNAILIVLAAALVVGIAVTIKNSVVKEDTHNYIAESFGVKDLSDIQGTAETTVEETEEETTKAE